MKLRILRTCSIAVGFLWLLTAMINAQIWAAPRAQSGGMGGTIPLFPPVLLNSEFECATG